MTENLDDNGPLRSGPGEPDALIDEIHKQGEAALAEAIRDPSAIAARRLLGQIFERELDELSTAPGSSYFSAKPENSNEKDKRKREERLLMGAVSAHVARALKEFKIRPIANDEARETPGGGEYILTCRDDGRREYEAKWGLELAESLNVTGGNANLVERIGQAVAREILRERERYFSRMK